MVDRGEGRSRLSLPSLISSRDTALSLLIYRLDARLRALDHFSATLLTLGVVYPYKLDLLKKRLEKVRNTLIERHLNA